METSSRDEVLTRYRSLRDRSLHHQTRAVQGLPPSALIQQAKRLGLTVGRHLVLKGDDALNYVCDLALYTAPRGRARAIEQYVRMTPAIDGGDDHAVLQSMLQARFSLWKVEARHETIGLILRDLIRDETTWLVDEGLAASAPIGLVLATRLISPDVFSMTCGASVTVDKVLFGDVLDACHVLARKDPEAVVEDRRFATAMFRLKLQNDLDVFTTMSAVA